MDGREGMTLSASSSYYLQRGVAAGPVSGSQPSSGFHIPPGFRSIANSSIQAIQPSVRAGGGGSGLSITPSHVDFTHGVGTALLQSSESVKRKRGRPRKYVPDRTMALALSPMSAPTAGAMTVGAKRGRGRPPGTGRKQQLATLGHWMTESAGLAFAPHIISVAAGEDVAAKILSFSQQRPRAVCIMSGNGTVSAVTLCQTPTSGGNVTYEGRFEILCLSGSFLLSESGGGGRNRMGGVNVSLSSLDGHVIGGVTSRLISASTVHVVVCSFVYGGGGATKVRSRTDRDELIEHGGGSGGDAVGGGLVHNTTYMALEGAAAAAMGGGGGMWGISRNIHSRIDLAQG